MNEQEDGGGGRGKGGEDVDATLQEVVKLSDYNEAMLLVVKK